MNEDILQAKIDALYRSACERLDLTRKYMPDNRAAIEIATDSVYGLTGIASVEALMERQEQKEGRG